MSLFGKKQQLSQSGKLEKTPPPKDISGFGGKSYIPQEKGRDWMRSDEAFRTTNIPKERREKYWKEITKGTGYFLEKREAERKLKELSMKKFKPGTAAEKGTIRKENKILKGFLGKK